MPEFRSPETDIANWGAYGAPKPTPGVMGLKSPQLPGFKTPSFDGMNAPDAGPQLDMAWDPMNEPGVGPQLPGGATTPDVMGQWTKGAGIAADIGGIGLGIYNAMETSKMNDFMRGYYGDQMDMQRTDFANMARSTNEEMASREQRRMSARGQLAGSAESEASIGAHMDQWGAEETY